MDKIKADVGIKDYHLKFIHNANIKYIKANKTYKRIISSKNSTHKYLMENIDNIKESLNLNLAEYNEYLNNEYDENELLLKEVNRLYKTKEDNREYVLQLLKYCNLIKAEVSCKTNVEKYDRERNMKLREYEYLISKFFYKMHEQLLNGDVYKLGKGLGQIYIERRNKTNESKKIDFQETKKRKQFLIDNGYKIYDKKEAEMAERMGIKYDGIDYRVKMQNMHVDVIRIDTSKYWNSRKYIDIKYADYVSPELRNMTYAQIVEENSRINDIYDLRLSLKRKLSILLTKFPEQGINYIRQ